MQTVNKALRSGSGKIGKYHKTPYYTQVMKELVNFPGLTKEYIEANRPISNVIKFGM